MKNFYYDGDSFSFVCVENNTGSILAQRLGLDLIHHGIVKKSPRAIIRTAFRYCAKGLHRDTFMCIGLGVSARLDYVKDERNTLGAASPIMAEELYTHTVTVDDVAKNKQMLDLYSFDFMETNILIDLIMLHDYLLLNGARFIIHNLGKNYHDDLHWPFSMNIKNEIDKRPRIVNFYKDSLHDLMAEKNLRGYDYAEFGFMSHPDEAGHRMYADFLLPHVMKYIKED